MTEVSPRYGGDMPSEADQAFVEIFRLSPENEQFLAEIYADPTPTPSDNPPERPSTELVPPAIALIRDVIRKRSNFGPPTDKGAARMALFLEEHSKAEVTLAFRQYAVRAQEAMGRASAPPLSTTAPPASREGTRRQQPLRKPDE
jgi:hypothetical protein